MNQEQPVSLLLRRLPLFSRLSPPQLELVAGQCQRLALPPGSRLSRQGEAFPGLYYFLTGGAQILSAGADGIERSLGDLHAGYSYSEDALFFSDLRQSSVQVVRPTEALFLSQEAFTRLTTAYPELLALLVLSPELQQRVQERINARPQQGVASTEQVLLRTRRHWWRFVGPSLRSTALFAALLFLAWVAWRLNFLAPFLPLSIVGVAFLIQAVLALYYILEWANDWYIITNQRIIHDEKSLLRLTDSRQQALFNNIQNIKVVRVGPVSELFNFGSLVVSTAGTQGSLVLDLLGAPYRAQDIILAQLRQRGIALGGSLGGGSPNASADDSSFEGMINTARPHANPIIGIWRTLFPAFRTVEGDRIIYRRHWSVLVGNMWQPTAFYVALVALLSVALSGRVPFLEAIPRPVVFVGVLLWLAVNTFWWYWQYADWRDDLFIIDTDSLTDLKRRPLWLAETRTQAGITQIQNVTSVVAGLLQRIFNVGDVVVQTAAEQGRLVFEDVGNPQGIAEEILTRVQRFQERKASATKQQQQDLIDQYMQQRNG